MDEMRSAKHTKDMAVVRASEGRPSSHGRSGYRDRASVSAFIRSYRDGIRWTVLGPSHRRDGRSRTDWTVGERTKAASMIINKRRAGHGLLALAHIITIVLLIALFLFVWSNL